MKISHFKPQKTVLFAYMRFFYYFCSVKAKTLLHEESIRIG